MFQLPRGFFYGLTRRCTKVFWETEHFLHNETFPYKFNRVYHLLKLQFFVQELTTWIPFECQFPSKNPRRSYVFWSKALAECLVWICISGFCGFVSANNLRTWDKNESIRNAKCTKRNDCEFKKKWKPKEKRLFKVKQGDYKKKYCIHCWKMMLNRRTLLSW